MKRLVSILTIVLVSTFVVQPAGAQSVEEQIAQAITPLPEDLRADATVYTYDPATGERRVLRKGANHVECQPRNAEGFTRCSSTVTGPRRDLQAKLQAEGKSGEELQAALAAATQAGKVDPVPFGTLGYRLYEKDDRIQLLWTVRLPGAKSEDLGLSTASQRDNSLAGKGLPWMMREGTPGAHLMIPINATELSNRGGASTRTNTKAIEDSVKHSVLPLPDDMKNDATVVTYDPKTGERKVLRQGTNMFECRTRDSNGFTSCSHKALAPVSDLRAKLTAQGKSPEEIQAAVAEAREKGAIPSSTFGSVFYRLYEENDRIQYLWVMLLPDATSEELGMPTGSQRDNALAGKGLPWMMREGTPGAHLMIPINATELSNPN